MCNLSLKKTKKEWKTYKYSVKKLCLHPVFIQKTQIIFLGYNNLYSSKGKKLRRRFVKRYKKIPARYKLLTKSVSTRYN